MRRQVAASLDHLGLGQAAPSDRHHRVGGQDQALIVLIAVGAQDGLRGNRFLPRQSLGEIARQFAFLRGLVHSRRQQAIRLDANLVEQPEAARRSRRENQFQTSGHPI